MASLDQIIHNPGFHYVAIEIFLYLDPKSLGNCRLLSKVYKNFIDNTKPLLILTIKHANSKRELILRNAIAKHHKHQNVMQNMQYVFRGGLQFKNLISQSNIQNKLFFDMCNDQLEKSDLQTVFEFMKNIWANPNIIPKEYMMYEMNIFNYVLRQGHVVEVMKSKLFEDFVKVIISLVIKNGAKLNFKLEDILISAICNKNVTLMEKVLNHTIQSGNNFDLNMGAHGSKWLPLHHASMSMNPEIVKLLLYYPSYKKVKLNKIPTTLELESISIFDSSFAQRLPFHLACSNGPIEVVDLFLDYILKNDKDFDFNMPDDLGRTCMYWASSCGFGDDGSIANRLLTLHKEKKITLIFNHRDIYGGGVFWHKFAAHPRTLKQIENLKMVLDLSMETDQNIDLDITARHGWIVLHCACSSDKKSKESDIVATVKLLLEHYSKTKNINPNAKNNDGNTPLHLACKKGSFKVVGLFVDFQLVNDIKNNNGLTPLEVALKNGYQEIVQLLSQHGPPAEIPKGNE